MCFEMYRGDNKVNDWLQCACSRWLHEECITDNVYDKLGIVLTLLFAVRCLMHD